ncbi:DUF6132 family protein [Ferruginibacter sp. SUN002]|uniref:DUF6132 family protein n=1 Tax=Ferruginibacter sp. SUN002 TaxID=2937789 RepID=UPI003D366B75
MIRLKKHQLYLAGMLIGGLSGYTYWYFVGCTSGSCPITSNPVKSTLYGATLGGLSISLLK